MSASFGAKNSSLAATTAPPNRSPARSGRSVKLFIMMSSRAKRGISLLGFAGNGRARSLASLVMTDAFDIRCMHHTKQLTTSVGRNVVPMVQRGRFDDEARVRIPDD